MKHTGKLQAAVVVLVILGFFGVIAALLKVLQSDVPAGMKEVLLIMCGALCAEFAHVVQFALKARADELLATGTQPPKEPPQ